MSCREEGGEGIEMVGGGGYVGVGRLCMPRFIEKSAWCRELF